MPHSHREGGPVCDLSTKKACDDRYTDWQAMQQVILAHRIEDTKPYRKGKSLFDQLVRYVHDEQADLMNDDGNPHMGPWPLRLRAALARYRSGDVPGYNLYAPPGV